MVARTLEIQLLTISSRPGHLSSDVLSDLLGKHTKRIEPPRLEARVQGWGRGGRIRSGQVKDHPRNPEEGQLSAAIKSCLYSVLHHARLHRVAREATRPKIVKSSFAPRYEQHAGPQKEEQRKEPLHATCYNLAYKLHQRFEPL